MTKCCHTYAGRSRSGQLYDERRKHECDVQRYLNGQWANQKRKWIQKQDSMFSQNYPQRFRSNPKGTAISSLSILKLLCKTVFTDQTRPMELCDFVIPPECAFCDYFLAEHTDVALDSTSLVDLILFWYDVLKNIVPHWPQVISLCVITPCII